MFIYFFKQEYKKKLLQKRKLGYVKLKPTELKQKEIIDTYTGPKLNIIIKCKFCIRI